MLFEPPIDDLVKKVGNKYALTVLMAGRARELQKKIPINYHIGKQDTIC